MHTIAEILASDGRPSWQESVALVQEIASQLAPGQPVPATDDLLLAEDGTLSFGFAGESANPQVTDLGGLLIALLTGSTAPPSLVDFANENGRPEPAHPTLDGFRRALAFYERPNRRADVTAVASRLAARAQADHARQLMAQIREKARAQEEAETPAPRTVPLGPVVRRFSSRQVLIAAGLVLVTLSGGAVLHFGILTGSADAGDPNAVRGEALPSAPAASAPEGSDGGTSAATAPSATIGRTLPDAARNPAPASRSVAAPVRPSRSGTAIRQVSGLSSSSRPSAPRSAPPMRKSGEPRSPGGQPERSSFSVDAAIVQPRPLPVPRGAAPPERAGLADASGVRGGLSEGVPVYSPRRSRRQAAANPPPAVAERAPAQRPDRLSGVRRRYPGGRGIAHSDLSDDPVSRSHARSRGQGLEVQARTVRWPPGEVSDARRDHARRLLVLRAGGFLRARATCCCPRTDKAGVAKGGGGPRQAAESGKALRISDLTIREGTTATRHFACP